MDKVQDGVKAIVVSSSKILLFHRDNNPNIRFPDCWHIVGGAVEEGESPEKAVVRELEEETSFVPTKFVYFGKELGSRGEAVFSFVFKISDDDEKLFKHGQTVKEGQGIGFYTKSKALELNLTPHSRTWIENNLDIVLNSQQ